MRVPQTETEDDLPMEIGGEESDEVYIPPSETGASEETALQSLIYHEPETPTVRVRRAGSSREQTPSSPGVEEWDFQKLFATFQVNWRASSPYYYLGRRSRRALLINWSVDDLKSVEAVSRIYEDIARRCPGQEAQDAQGVPVPGSLICPCRARYGADPEVWKGLPCPAENLQAFQHFTQFIRDLEIKAENHVDVMQVVEIVKLLIYESRCDQDLQDEGRMYDLQVGQLNQQSGVAYWNKVTPVAISTQGILFARRTKIYKDLVATRDARTEARRKEIKAAAALGNASAANTAIGLMTQLNQRNIERRRSMQIEDAGRVNRAVVDDIDEGEEDDVIVVVQSSDTENTFELTQTED